MWELDELLVNEDFGDRVLVGRVTEIDPISPTVTSFTIKTIGLKVNMAYSSTQQGLESVGWKYPVPLALDESGQVREDV